MKVLFITQSGAEGISLKNVRQVHITEPYWNKNRIDQVIGRANRTCSHMALPLKDRNFTVYRYTITFSEKQLDSAKKDMEKIITRHDKLKTTDQIIYNIAAKKSKLIEHFLTCMKQASVDCHLNDNGSCFSFPIDFDVNKNTYTVDINKDIVDKYVINNTKTLKKKPIKITIVSKNTSYIYIKDTHELFDYNLYIQTNTLSNVGYLKIIDDKSYLLKLFK